MADSTKNDTIPLGVTGRTEISATDFLARVGRHPEPTNVLRDDSQRLVYIEKRLTEALNVPLLYPPGVQSIASDVFATTNGLLEDLLPHFAEKILQTLRDGERHDRLLVSPSEPPIAISFVAREGSHLEALAGPERYYLEALFNQGQKLKDKGIVFSGLLSIEAYVRDNPIPEDPAQPLQNIFAIDVEYACLPGVIWGYPGLDGPIGSTVLVNRERLSPGDRAKLEAFDPSLFGE